ncbi:MAG: phosphatidate cytidylyltransferase [Micavibrio aeruginosavorus]|uniref:Phosphatidate cytidylyltransferase n=1 Tax=Micavibrio aeruginosavorus TaxID=349221 RepID=A0A7T5R0R1_9BACT|nr:MAG: phosphatidate cytidylyltransferase [Micavibrio aeruginosavorus]
MNTPAPDSRFSGLAVRAISGLVLAPLMVTIIVAGGFWFIGLMVLSSLVALYEWYGFSKTGPHAMAVLLLGVVYLCVSYSSYVWLRFGFEAGAWLALTVVLCVWASDTGAYFAGKFVGGPKMCPVLSPKKTWAGLAGSVLSCALMLEILLQISPRFAPLINTETGFPPDRAWWGVLLVGAVLGVIGQFGDLFISFFKRRAHLKDTGHIIPGHGGLLDRIDALLLVAPIFLLIYMVCLP